MSKQFCNDLKNDVFFKYLLHDDLDPDCIFMLKLFIENILNIKCHHRNNLCLHKFNENLPTFYIGKFL